MPSKLTFHYIYTLCSVECDDLDSSINSISDGYLGYIIKV